MSTRRKFIRDFSALSVSAAFLPTTLAAVPRRGREVPAAGIEFAALAGLVHSTFDLRDATGATSALELIEARLTSGNDDSPGAEVTESFSLIFRGDGADPLGQDTYEFEHSQIGCFAMFIVPVGSKEPGCCFYEAVFNRLRTTGPVAPFPLLT